MCSNIPQSSVDKAEVIQEINNNRVFNIVLENTMIEYLEYSVLLQICWQCFLLAHLCQRLINELIVYPFSILRPSNLSPSVYIFQRSPLKPLSQSKPIFMWSLLEYEE